MTQPGKIVTIVMSELLKPTETQPKVSKQSARNALTEFFREVEFFRKAARKGTHRKNSSARVGQAGRQSARTSTGPGSPVRSSRLSKAALLYTRLARNPEEPQGLSGFFVFILFSFQVTKTFAPQIFLRLFPRPAPKTFQVHLTLGSQKHFEIS